MARTFFNLMNVPIEIEIVALRPHQLDGVEPFLCVLVARGMGALPDAEHLEFALVPADHDVQPEPAFADVIGGDHLLRCNHRVKQRSMDRAEHGDALVAASSPDAHVTVSSVASWYPLSPP